MERISVSTVRATTIYNYKFNSVFDIPSAVKFILKFKNGFGIMPERIFLNNGDNKITMLGGNASQKQIFDVIEENPNVNRIIVFVKHQMESFSLAIDLKTFIVSVYLSLGTRIKIGRFEKSVLLNCEEHVAKQNVYKNTIIQEYESSDKRDKHRDEFISCYKESPMFVEAVLTEEQIKKLDDFAKRISVAKLNEDEHKTDNGSEVVRWSTGIGGEIAVGNFLGMDFADLTIGKTSEYEVSDLIKLKLHVGVKTSEKYKFPIIKNYSKEPEIICIKKNKNTFIICGLAMPNILNTYQSDEYIIADKLKAKGTKTAFYGFRYLKPFSSYEELKKLVDDFNNGKHD